MIWVVDGSFLSISGADWAGFLVNLLFKSLLVLTAAYAMTLFFSRWPAMLKSRIWTLVFCVLLGLPLVSALSQQVNLAGLTTPFISVVQSGAITSNDLESSTAGSAAHNTSLGNTSPAPQDNSSPAINRLLSAVLNRLIPQHLTLVIVLWLLGAIWFAGRTTRRFYAGLSAAKSARPLTSKEFDSVKQYFISRQPVELRVSEDVTAPFVTGMKTQFVVLPVVLANWDDGDLRAVFQHELAHVRRHDLLRLIIYDLVCALYWFNPLVHLAAKRAALDAEMACDDLVCGKEIPALSYARRLLWFARQASGNRKPLRTPGMSGKSGIERRIKYLLDPQKRSIGQSGASRKVAFVVIPALVALVSLAAMTLQIVATNMPSPAFAEKPAAVPADQFNLESTPRPVAGGNLLRYLFTASANGDVETVRHIIENNPDFLNAKTYRGMTLLALAAWNNNFNVTEYLITRGANPDLKNNNGLTPLFCAVDRGRPTMARLLINGGADLTTRGYRRRTLLHMAARSGDASLANSLIERGASVNATDSRGATPLDLASRHGEQPITSILKSHGAVNGTGLPPDFTGAKRPKSLI